MNDRIDKLMKRSYVTVNSDNHIFSPERFAELIIHGCIDAVISVPLPNEYEQRCAESIRKYFGVK